MSSKLKAETSSVSSSTPTTDSQVAAAGPEDAAQSTPLYEMVSDGQIFWHNINDAAYFFCTSENLGPGTRIKDSKTGAVRPMTAAEKQKFLDLALSLHA